MRNLRERLMAVSSPKPQQPAAPVKNTEPFFCREHVIPIGKLCGVERTTFDEIRAIDPLFSGKS